MEDKIKYIEKRIYRTRKVWNEKKSNLRMVNGHFNEKEK